MTDSEIKLERQKCKDSILYFYNNYCVLVDENGNKIHKAQITQDEFDGYMAEFDFLLKRRNGGIVKVVVKK